MVTSNPSWADALLDQIADRVFERLASHIAANNRMPDKLSYSESEAAELLGIAKHVLKGARERGEIQPAKIGKGYRYGREMLVKFAEARS